MRDARTRRKYLSAANKWDSDNGRGTSDDIDPRYPGCEGWSAAGILTAADGTVISTKYTMPANFLCYWDGDLGPLKFRTTFISASGIPKKKRLKLSSPLRVVLTVNGTKANPSLTADLFGDWREEVMYPLKDGSALRIYTTTTPTSYKNPYTYARHSIQNARCIPKRLLQSAYTPKLLSWF
mgnify:CR=1 FL=1